MTGIIASATSTPDIRVPVVSVMGAMIFKSHLTAKRVLWVLFNITEIGSGQQEKRSDFFEIVLGRQFAQPRGGLLGGNVTLRHAEHLETHHELTNGCRT